MNIDDLCLYFVCGKSEGSDETALHAYTRRFTYHELNRLTQESLTLIVQVNSECTDESEPLLQTYEPRHEISNNVVCATSKGSDQPAHTRSLIRAFASRLNIR